MNQAAKFWTSARPSISVLAAILVVAGLLLTIHSWWWLLLTILGSTVPGLMRELGWLNDRDEFQLQAIHRAGYHAYLASVAVGLLLLAWLRATAAGRDATQDVGGAQNLAMLLVALAWFTWFFSWLVSFWGAQRAAIRVLLCFGCIWLTFTILSNTGNEWTGWTALLMHMLLAVPFFVLSYLAGRIPKIAGVLLIGLALSFAWMFGAARLDTAALLRQGPVLVLFIGPLLASGIALLANSDSPDAS